MVGPVDHSRTVGVVVVKCLFPARRVAPPIGVACRHVAYGAATARGCLEATTKGRDMFQDSSSVFAVCDLSS